MTLDATQIRVAGSGALWRAPAGTTLPTDSVTAWGAAFKNLGYATDTGFAIKQALSTSPIKGWQSIEQLRLVTTDLIRTLLFELEQTNADTLALAWGGATITPTTGGAYSLELSSSSEVFESIIGIDWNDGTTSQRLIVQRAALTMLPEIKFTRTGAVTYPLEFQALVPADGSPSILMYGIDTAVGGV